MFRRVYNYSIGIQRDLGFKMVLDVAYAGASGRHLLEERNINTFGDKDDAGIAGITRTASE
jgi:hypothetical protein